MNKWEFPSCNYCGRNKIKVLLDKVTTWEHPEKFRIVKCLNCGLIYLNPRPKIKYINSYYCPEKYWGLDIVNYNRSKIGSRTLRKNNYANIYRQIFKHKKIGSILDIGCGTGIFLTKFKDLGWKVEGIDLSKEAANYAMKNYDINVSVGDFLDVNLGNKKFDVITLNSSLEHFYRPKEILMRTFPLLKINGLLVITVPNFNSLGRIIFGKSWLGFHPPKHLYHFSFSSLMRMLTKAGFKAKKVTYWYFRHNYYCLFESFRYKFSPKFRKAGESKEKLNKMFNPIKYLSKIVAVIVSLTISFLGSLIGKGETITIYADKT